MKLFNEKFFRLDDFSIRSVTILNKQITVRFLNFAFYNLSEKIFLVLESFWKIFLVIQPITARIGGVRLREGSVDFGREIVLGLKFGFKSTEIVQELGQSGFAVSERDSLKERENARGEQNRRGKPKRKTA